MSTAVYFWVSWNRTQTVIDHFLADPAMEITSHDYATVMHYVVGDLTARQPWRRLSAADEHGLIVASLRQIELRGDPSVYILLLTSWQHYRDFSELPAMAAAFCQKRNAAAAIVLSYSEGAVPGMILDDVRTRALIQGSTDERFQIALIAISSPEVFAKTADAYAEVHQRDLMKDKAWMAYKARMSELHLKGPE